MQDSGALTSVPSLTLMFGISLQIFITSVLDLKHTPQVHIMSNSFPLSPSTLLSAPLLNSPPHPMAGKCSKTKLKLQPSFDFFF